MNEHLKVSPNGIRILTDFEKGPTDGSVPLTEGGAAMSPYVCPGDELTIGYGCTHWFDGSEVAIHHRLNTEAEARELLDINLDSYEAAVRKCATRELNQDQFDAFVGQCFNIGIGAFSECSALKAFNEGRMEDAAANFGMWTGSTCARPPRTMPNDVPREAYADKMIQDHKGLWRWKGPDGNYCRYMLRYTGLLRRHYAEALLFMGKNWQRAIIEGEVQLTLTPTHPDQAKWNAAKNRWQDEVSYRTPFKDVLAYAYYHELPGAAPAPEHVLTEAAPEVHPDAGEGSADALTQPAAGPSAPSPIPAPGGQSGAAGEPAEASVPSPQQTPPARPVPKKPVVIAAKTVNIDAIPYGQVLPENGAKNMTDSKRFVGMLIVGAGSLVQVLAAREVVSSTAGAIFFDVSRDPVLVALLVGAAFWIIGSMTKKRGQKVITQGMQSAQHLLK